MKHYRLLSQRHGHEKPKERDGESPQQVLREREVHAPLVIPKQGKCRHNPDES